MTQELAKTEPKEIRSLRQDPAPMQVGAMLQAIIAKGITGDAVGAVEQLVKLQERMASRQAERDFAAAFVALQAEMPKVQATKGVPAKDGTIKYKFAPYDEIMKQVGPLLQSHGFTVTFSTDYLQGTPQRLVQHCTLQHVTGHKRTNSFAVRIGDGPPGASATQADGAANTYAKRYALINALNITGRGRERAQRRGRPALPRENDNRVLATEARRLEERCDQLKVDVKKFLKYAGAESFETIRTSKHEALVKMLDRKADEAVPI